MVLGVSLSISTRCLVVVVIVVGKELQKHKENWTG